MRLKTSQGRSNSGGVDLYKIKLRTVGFRLVYQVQGKLLTVLALSVGKRGVFQPRSM